MTAHELEITARALVAPGKGILAADESHGTIEKRFKGISVANTEDNRRAYRDMLFTTPTVAESISGVTVFEETIRKRGLDGTRSQKLPGARGIIRGIKFDDPFLPDRLVEQDHARDELRDVRRRE